MKQRPMTSNAFSSNQNREKVVAAAIDDKKRYSTPAERIKVDPYKTPTVILEKKIQRESSVEVNKIK